MKTNEIILNVLRGIMSHASQFRSIETREKEIAKILDICNINYRLRERCDANSCVVRVMKNEYRLFYTCGHGRYNYGLCFIVDKENIFNENK